MGLLLLERARTHFALWSAWWLQYPDRSTLSVFSSDVVREQLFRLCNSPDVDSSWLLWIREAEARLARAYLSLVALPSRVPVVMLVEALFLSTL